MSEKVHDEEMGGVGENVRHGGASSTTMATMTVEGEERGRVLRHEGTKETEAMDIVSETEVDVEAGSDPWQVKFEPGEPINPKVREPDNWPVHASKLASMLICANQNWGVKYRWYLTFASGLLCLNSTFSSSIPAGIADSLQRDFPLDAINPSVLSISLVRLALSVTDIYQLTRRSVRCGIRLWPDRMGAFIRDMGSTTYLPVSLHHLYRSSDRQCPRQ